MKTGDIILIRFPFTDLSSQKLRPCVVIALTQNKYVDIIIAAISSQVQASFSKNEIKLLPSEQNGLVCVSVLKVDKLFTLQQNLYFKHLGTLDIVHIEKMKAIFKSLVD